MSRDKKIWFSIKENAALSWLEQVLLVHAFPEGLTCTGTLPLISRPPVTDLSSGSPIAQQPIHRQELGKFLLWSVQTFSWVWGSNLWMSDTPLVLLEEKEHNPLHLTPFPDPWSSKTADPSGQTRICTPSCPPLPSSLHSRAEHRAEEELC